jgi:hypothetical protein
MSKLPTVFKYHVMTNVSKCMKIAWVCVWKWIEYRLELDSRDLYSVSGASDTRHTETGDGDKGTREDT